MRNNEPMKSLVLAELSENVLEPTFFMKIVADTRAGAIVTFSGDVRNHDNGKSVTSLEYEAHPDAKKIMETVTNAVVQKHDVIKVAVGHRYGPIAMGESAFVVAVSAAHRKEAFEACQEIVDEVKANLPVWKHQVFADGSDEWVNFA